ncbi:hypothetical protein FRC96_15065 [Lujinxingia vulgaris]|uniref:Uncharacterized protein n=1 Tax=Lujinxingia vulgaris TaxID=2600176 RepID=A0A5C6X528_9DELT|nr:hypothetical protein [Lujinxingia vulgaris]TXD33790.1 hypothetical protein FRC96_15065 [Lujinxingia vulgaris]
MSEEGRALLNRRDVAVLEFPFVGDDEKLLELDQRGLLAPNTVLLQSPFDDDYTSPTNADNFFAIRKFTLFSTLCQQLGARRVQTTQLIIETEGQESSVKLSASYAGVRGSVKPSSSKQSSLAKSLTLDDTFQGGTANIQAARTLIRKHGLANDPVFTSLIEQAEYAGNRLESREFTVSLTQELKNRLQLAMQVRLPNGLSLGSTFELKTMQSTEYRVTTLVEF